MYKTVFWGGRRMISLSGVNKRLGSFRLKDISIPSSATSIEKFAFDCCDKLTIHAPAGSYAETYARENKLPFAAE